MRKNVIYVIVGGLAVSLSGLAGCSGGNGNLSSGAPTAVQLAATYTALAGTKINDVSITSTKWFEASGGNPYFCQVKGTRAPYLDIEIDVPDSWSGRLSMPQASWSCPAW